MWFSEPSLRLMRYENLKFENFYLQFTYTCITYNLLRKCSFPHMSAKGVSIIFSLWPWVFGYTLLLWGENNATKMVSNLEITRDKNTSSAKTDSSLRLMQQFLHSYELTSSLRLLWNILLRYCRRTKLVTYNPMNKNKPTFRVLPVSKKLVVESLVVVTKIENVQIVRRTL